VITIFLYPGETITGRDFIAEVGGASAQFVKHAMGTLLNELLPEASGLASC
jgi:hypothetical protein